MVTAMLLNTSATCKPHKFVKGVKKKRKKKGKKNKRSRKAKEVFTGSYKDYMKSNVWRRKRTWIYKRDGGKCVICELKAANVHHWFYTQPYGKERGFQLSSLCGRCHSIVHDEYDKELKIIQKSKTTGRKELISDLKQSLSGHLMLDDMHGEFIDIIG